MPNSEARKEYKQKWYDANREKVKAQNRARYLARKAEIKAKVKEWKAAHPEQTTAYKRAWEAKNPERARHHWRTAKKRERSRKALAQGLPIPAARLEQAIAKHRKSLIEFITRKEI